MRESILILVIVAGVLAAPILCAVGVAAHECVCDPVDCCDEEAFCEQDPCDDGYQRENGRQNELETAGAALRYMAGVEHTADGHGHLAPSASPPSRNLPYPDSDLPLRI
jgi:hypothetical protein